MNAYCVDDLFIHGVFLSFCFFFFFNDPATTEIYTLSLHDALPICVRMPFSPVVRAARESLRDIAVAQPRNLVDRKSTRLNSSHPSISYAVFCLKKKKYRNY